MSVEYVFKLDAGDEITLEATVKGCFEDMLSDVRKGDPIATSACKSLIKAARQYADQGPSTGILLLQDMRAAAAKMKVLKKLNW